MYYELGEFLWHMAWRRRLWKDGELWSAIIVGALSGWLSYCYPASIDLLRDRYGELLTVASIVFGFVLTTLFVYIQAAGEWSRDPRVARVAEKLIDWHVWTVMCLLVLIALILLLWLAEALIAATPLRSSVSHGCLVFLASYCTFQILNHVLTVRWVFRKRSVLKDGPGHDGQTATSPNERTDEEGG